MLSRMTMAEKVLSRASKRDFVTPGEFITADVDILMGNDSSFYKEFTLMLKNGFTKVWNPDKIVVVIDHRVPATNIQYAEEHRKIREFVSAQQITHFYDVGAGICHILLPEKGHALPGHLIVGGDSHMTTLGALGAASCGIGNTEVAYVMGKGSLWFQVPETIRFVLNGKLPMGVTAKDIILKIAGEYSAEVAQYKSIEFSGSAAKELTIDERMTMSNMGVEIGAKFAFFEVDEETLAYLRPRTKEPLVHFGPDPNCRYSAVYDLDVSALEPQIACPHTVDNVRAISKIGEVSVQQAFIGSCTNSRLGDLKRAAAILDGKKVHNGTRLLVIPGSHEVYQHIADSGVLQTLLDAGAVICPPGCGPCGGGHLGVLASGETAISTTNRNFKGRMGSTDSFVYLASPETVAASAIEGKIADPRKYLT